MEMPETLQIFLVRLQELSRGIRIRDLLDIAIIAFAIYKMLSTIRKSSSGRVLKGVLILLFAIWLSHFLELTAVSFLLNRAVEWGILALIVLFQPEIRRFLERMGSSTLGFHMVFSSQDSPRELEVAIRETVEAYTSMSRDKVGALMVFERKDHLDDIIKTGTALDCGVSSELLKNMFWNKAPLHDGAVIVRNGRIIGAGCMLPMSGNVNLSRDLGMRHRAGIGVSEETDAVTVIVSEETGSISAAVGGMLKRHLAPETLEHLLRNELLNDEQDSKKKASGVVPRLSGLFNRNKREED